MTFAELLDVEAERYRARIEADHEPRLAELARLLVEAGQSLDEFDGTIASLESLWEWALDEMQLGYPDIPANAQYRRREVEPYPLDVPAREHLAELVAHYLFEVAEVCLGGARWVVADAPRYTHHHLTMIVCDGDGEAGPPRKAFEYATQALASAEQDEYSQYRSAEFFVSRALDGTFLTADSERLRILALPRGASVLERYLGRHESTPELTLGASADLETADKNEGAVGDELILARPGSSAEVLEEARPIDAEAVVHSLIELGFVGADMEEPTVDAILAEGFHEFLLADTAMVTTLASVGELRAVQLSSIRAYPVQWAELVGEFAALGERIGAKLAREDEF